MISHTARAILVLLLVSLATAPVSGDGAFVWNKGADIQEPSQKAIIYYAAGREDLLLQVRYQGPATKFGWMVPVPGKPEVAKASIESFYELSRVVQSREGRRADSKTEGVEVLQRHTVGAYDVATTSRNPKNSKL